MTLLLLILCEESIARIPESWKRFPDPDSGKVVGVLKRKSNIFRFLWENRRFLGFSSREIDWAHSQTVKTLPWPWFREEIGVLKRKSKNFRFNTLYSVLKRKSKIFRFLPENSEFENFCCNTPTPSLNQGHVMVFRPREYTQSIPRPRKPLKVGFPKKI